MFAALIFGDPGGFLTFDENMAVGGTLGCVGFKCNTFPDRVQVVGDILTRKCAERYL